MRRLSDGFDWPDMVSEIHEVFALGHSGCSLPRFMPLRLVIQRKLLLKPLNFCLETNPGQGASYGNEIETSHGPLPRDIVSNI